MYDLELPSGNKIQFRAPRNSDRHSVLRFMDERGKGPSEVELLAAYCLTATNGTPIQEPNPAHRMSPWSLKDVQFYQGVFLEMFFLNGDTDVDKIKEEAKKLVSPASVAG